MLSIWSGRKFCHVGMAFGMWEWHYYLRSINDLVNTVINGRVMNLKPCFSRQVSGIQASAK